MDLFRKVNSQFTSPFVSSNSQIPTTILNQHIGSAGFVPATSVAAMMIFDGCDQ